MAKYEVKFACGCVKTIELYGSEKERQRKIEYYERERMCEKCYAEYIDANTSIKTEEVTMSYREYKTEYADCQTKYDSYDRKEKTIVVYVPVERIEEKKEEASKEVETKEEINEVTMSYREYKTNYYNCKTKYNSYNAKDKTIVVLVPAEKEEIKEEISEEAMVECAKEAAEVLHNISAKDDEEEVRKNIDELINAIKHISKYENPEDYFTEMRPKFKKMFAENAEEKERYLASLDILENYFKTQSVTKSIA